jgi:hypothetical protein
LLYEGELCLSNGQDLYITRGVKEVPSGGNTFSQGLVQVHTFFCRKI